MATRGSSFAPPVEYLHPSEDGEALRKDDAWGSPDGSVSNDSGSTASSQWFAVYTTSRHEKRIAQHFTQRAIEHYLPLYSSNRIWRDGSKVKLELPLFPSYLFVRIHRSERVSVLSVPGALAVVGGTGGEPVPVPDSTIESLRIGLREHKIEPHPLLRVGQRACIKGGAFAGMEGVVVRRKSGCRIVLTLEQVMQSIAIEVEADDLEPAHSVRPGPLSRTGAGQRIFQEL